jgi:hypothetical protein
MTNDVYQLVFQVAGWGVLSFIIIVLNWRIYRNPALVERGKEKAFDEWFNDTPEKKHERLQRYRRNAKLWLILAVIPLGLFLVGCFSLIVELWLRMR